MNVRRLSAPTGSEPTFRIGSPLQPGPVPETDSHGEFNSTMLSKQSGIFSQAGRGRDR